MIEHIRFRPAVCMCARCGSSFAPGESHECPTGASGTYTAPFPQPSPPDPAAYAYAECIALAEEHGAPALAAAMRERARERCPGVREWSGWPVGEPKERKAEE